MIAMRGMAGWRRSAVAALSAAVAAAARWETCQRGTRLDDGADAEMEAEAEAEPSSRWPQRRPKMFVRDPEAFARKWKKFSSDGLDKLMVIADFDYTLTPFFKPAAHGDERADSSHGILMTSAALPAAAVQSARDMFRQYYPIEQSPTLSRAEKLPFMVDWWTKQHDIMVAHKLTRQAVRAAVEESDVCFRDGFAEIFALLAREGVPTLIFSAGLYDVIHAVLDKEFAKLPAAKPPPNVHVVSNMMRFDADGVLIGFRGNLIHSLNKNASALEGTPFWRQCQLEKRHNILLLGDSLGDADMANGLEFRDDEIVRVGFLNASVNDKLDAYLERFDVVLTDDASLLPVELLLHQIAP